jgi:hypothetical protein
MTVLLGAVYFVIGALTVRYFEREARERAALTLT